MMRREQKRLNQIFGLLAFATFVISLILINYVGGWQVGLRIASWIVLFTTFALDWKYFGIDCIIYLGYSTWLWYDYGKRIGILLGLCDFSWALSKWWSDCVRARQVHPIDKFEARRKVTIRLTSVLIEDEWVCSICLDEDNQENVVKGSCGHRFHQDCIVKWVHSKTVCPLCRADIRSVSEATSREQRQR